MPNGKKDTIEEQVLHKQNEQEDVANTLLWLRDHSEHEKAPQIISKFKLDPDDIEALKFTGTTDDADLSEAVFEKIVSVVNRNKSVENVLTPELSKVLEGSSPGQSFNVGLLGGMTLEAAPHVLAVAKALTDKFIEGDDRDFGDIREENVMKFQQALEKIKLANPTAGTLGEITGFLGGAGKAVAKGIGKVAQVAGKVAPIAGKAVKAATLPTQAGIAGGFKEGKEGLKKEVLVAAGTQVAFKGAGKLAKGVVRGIEKLSNSAVMKAVGAEAKTTAFNLAKSLKRKGYSISSFGDEIAKMKTPTGKPMIVAGDTVVDTAIKSRQVMDAAGEKIGALLGKADEAGINAKTIVKRLVKNVINPLLKSGDSNDKLIAKGLAVNIKDFYKKFGKDKVVSVKELQAWRLRFSENVKQDSSKAVNRAAQAFDKTYRKAIEIVMKKVERTGNFPKGFMQAKKEFSLGSSFIETLEKEASPHKHAGITKVLSNLLVTRRSLMATGLISVGGGGLGTALAVGAAVEIASRKSASIIISMTKRGTLNSMAKKIMANIGQSGKYRPILNDAIKLGPKAIVGAHLALIEIDPKYNKKAMEK